MVSKERICDCCGKDHLHPIDSIYKLKYKGKTKYFCSYNCYVKIQKLKENKQNEEIDKIFDSVQREG